MDFPKSMPDIGLVNGQFVDEDITMGQAGTYIPSAWGNAVTREIINVIEMAGLEPLEGLNNQLALAIKQQIAGDIAGAATEEISGISKISTQYLVNEGLNDDTVVTPKKLAARLATMKAQYSPEYTITAGSQTVVNHSMGIDASVEFIYVCRAAQAGYSIGDTCEWKDYQFNSTSTSSSIGPYIHTRTNVSFTMAAGSSTASWLPHKTTGVTTSISLANWALQARIKP